MEPNEDEPKRGYFKNAGHCTRCGEPFGGNATAYMVRERIIWRWHGDGHPMDGIFWQFETVPVCDPCVTEAERENAAADTACEGCGQRMRCHKYDPRTVCSDRCAQRVRRRRHRASVRAVCTVCNETFTPKRGDARCCSNTCRQRAYRQRGGEPPKPAASQIEEAAVAGDPQFVAARPTGKAFVIGGAKAK